eukprot:CAMPEP_0168536434 /NCGR_PEP_ID=MMETSP0405-20121227/19548_1 /TAXON_ID=498012 /ORGANISM="Trichosphaerium sp, Strain Am-I-7 wt" /LENGTH=176 /DNA_ID=CAMNT_0008564441 /DNA_START=143 /DNA_END=670 /DNA_ORIENTATION=+
MTTRFNYDLKKHGKWLKINTATSQILEQEYFSHGKRHGKRLKWYDQLAVKSSYCKGDPNERRLMIRANYVNGKEQGKYEGWYMNGLLKETFHFVNGKMHGEYKYWYEDGTIYNHFVFKSENETYCEQWYNGQIRLQCTYVNDRPEGEYKSWYNNGKQEEHCKYVNNKLEGEYKSWY